VTRAARQVVRRQVALAGGVVDGTTGSPLAGAIVELSSVPASFREPRDSRRTVTDVSGRFTFIDLPSGAYGLAVSYPAGGRRYGAATAKATVKRNKAGDVALTWVDLPLPATGVSGKVTGPGSKPVVLASVQVKGGPEKAYTDGQGKYVLAGLESGPRTLVVTARGFKAAEKAVDLATPGSSKTVNVSLTQ
jgi:hypothetical protein